MLGKLMKYELKACGRIFIPLYIVILCVSAITGIFQNVQSSQVSIRAALMFLLVILFIGLAVVTVILIIQRFKKNLLDDEGYLMFTLPVSTKELILSKYITSLIYIILSGIVAMLAFMIILVSSPFWDISIDANFWNAINMILTQQEFMLTIRAMIIGGFLVYTMFIFSVYISLSIGQLPKFNKHKILSGIITFFIINIIIEIIESIVQWVFISKIYVNSQGVYSTLSVLNSSSIVGIIVDIIMIIAMFFITDWILSRKLNLE